MNRIAMTAQINNAVVVQGVIALLISLARRDKVASSAWMAGPGSDAAFLCPG